MHINGDHFSFFHYLYEFSRFYQILLHAHSIEWKIQLFPRFMHIKFIYSEKATKFYKIFTLLLSYVVPVKSKVKISQNFVAFSEYMNFIYSAKNMALGSINILGNSSHLFFCIFCEIKVLTIWKCIPCAQFTQAWEPK